MSTFLLNMLGTYWIYKTIFRIMIFISRFPNSSIISNDYFFSIAHCCSVDIAHPVFIGFGMNTIPYLNEYPSLQGRDIIVTPFIFI